MSSIIIVSTPVPRSCHVVADGRRELRQPRRRRAVHHRRALRRQGRAPRVHRMYRCPPQPTSTTGHSLERFPERARLKGVKAIAFDVEHVFARPAKAQYETLMAALAAHPADVVLAEPSSSAPRSCWRTRVRRVRRSSCAASAAARRESRYRSLRDGPAAGPHPQPSPQHRTGRSESPSLTPGLPRQSTTCTARCTAPTCRGTFVDWGRRRRRDRAVHRALVRIPPVRRARHASLRRAAVRHRLTGSATGMVGRSRRDPTRHPRHSGHVRQHRLRASHRPDVACACRRRCAGRGHNGRSPTGHAAAAPANARAATYLPYDELLPRTSVYVTNGGYGGVQYALTLRRADRRHRRQGRQAGGRRPRRVVRRRTAHQKRTTNATRPAPRHSRGAESATLPASRRRVAADMAAGPGFAGLADIVDRLVAQPHPIGGRQHQFGAGRLINSRLSADPASDH